MYKQTIITILLVFVAMTGQGQAIVTGTGTWV